MTTRILVLVSMLITIALVIKLVSDSYFGALVALPLIAFTSYSITVLRDQIDQLREEVNGLRGVVQEREKMP